jgi:hypothetical protein
MELANLIARVPVKKIKQANPDRFSQQGQSVIESLIMAGCLLPLIFGFFQMMRDNIRISLSFQLARCN